MPEAALTFIFEDSRSARCSARPGETALAAARRAGIALEADCMEGACGTCKARACSGAFDLGDPLEDALSNSERASGLTLLCQTVPQGDCVFELPYDSTRAMKRGPTPVRPATLVAIAEVARDVVRIEVLAEGPHVDYLAGQYANLQVEDGRIVRSYSMATRSVQGAPWVFYIRLLAGGAMSDWLRGATPGARVSIEGPFGHFYLRDPQRPIVMVAGGTGLAPMLAMLDHLAVTQGQAQNGAQDQTQTAPQSPANALSGRRGQQVLLLVGAGSDDELFGATELKRLQSHGAALDWRHAVIHPGPTWQEASGHVTTLLREDDLDGASDYYLCGPPAMIEAARDWLSAHAVPSARIHAERFIASGVGAR